MQEKFLPRVIGVCLAAFAELVCAQLVLKDDSKLVFDGTGIFSDQGLEATAIYWDVTNDSTPYPAHLRKDARDIRGEFAHRACETARGVGTGWRLANQLELDALFAAKVFPPPDSNQAHPDFPLFGARTIWTADKDASGNVGRYAIDSRYYPVREWLKTGFRFVTLGNATPAQVICVRGQHARLKETPTVAAPQRSELPAQSLRLTRVPDTPAPTPSAAVPARDMSIEEQQSRYNAQIVAKREAAQAEGDRKFRHACLTTDLGKGCACKRYFAGQSTSPCGK